MVDKCNRISGQVVRVETLRSFKGGLETLKVQIIGGNRYMCRSDGFLQFPYFPDLRWSDVADPLLTLSTRTDQRAQDNMQ